ncbi:MAG: WG repeat-containing protein [Flammeovirgaceae bacterium]|nr:MAG: WG repeat-containing protein [Flammeovirgaceae bacterium]
MRLVTILLVFLTHITQAQANAFQQFEEGGEIGLRNSQGVVVIPARYEALGWSDHSFSLITTVTGYKLDGKWGLINTSNQRITPPEYDGLVPADSRHILAVKQSPVTFRIKTGCLSANGKIIIPFDYTGIKLHGLRAITYSLDKDNQLKYGLIDLENNTILPALYQNIYPLGSLRYAVQNTSGKTALFTENGKAITSFVIDSIGPLQNDRAVYYQDGRQGLINRDGTMIKDAIYREIKSENYNWYGRLSDEWMVLSSSNTIAKRLAGDSLVGLSDGRFKLVTTHGTELLDEQLNPVTTKRFNSISGFSNGMAVFSDGDKKGIIRSNGTIVLPAAYHEVAIGSTHLFVAENFSGTLKWSLYNSTGQRVTKKNYAQIGELNEHLFWVTENGYQGAINKLGDEQIACVFDSLLETKGSLVVVKFRGQYGIISEKEEWIVTPQRNPIRLITSDRFLENSGNLITLKTLGGTILYFTTNKIEVEQEKLTEHLSDGGKWIINMNGQIISRELPPSEQTELVWPATEGYRMIKRNGRYGFIDNQARLMIPNRYEEAKPFNEGLAPIKIRNKWGFINHDDKIVVQPVYESVSSFEAGYCRVKLNGKYGLINKTGEQVLPTRYDELTVLPGGRILLKSDGSFGLSSPHGDVLLFPKYDVVTDLNNGFVIVAQQGKYGLVDLKGLTTIPLMYDYLFFNPAAGTYVGLVKKSWEEIK